MPRLVALDLGTANVKATVWNVSGRKATFVERLMEPVPQQGPAPAPLEVRIAALQALLSDHPELNKPGTVAGAVASGRDVTVHRVTMPFTDKRQLEKTLPFAVEAEVPFDLDDMVLGWRILKQDDSTEAMVALAEEASLRAMLDGLGVAKLEPRTMVADKELLARWALPEAPQLPAKVDKDEEPAPAPASPVVAVLDIGHTRSLVAIARDGVLLGSRVIDIGGAAITRAIQKGLGCSWANAERLKQGLDPQPDPGDDPGEIPIEAEPVPEPEDGTEEITEPDMTLPEVPVTPWDQLPAPGLDNLPEAVLQAVEDTVSRQLSEIRATLIAFEDSLGIEVQTVRLGGGGARLQGFAGSLQDDLGVSVQWATDLFGNPVPCEHLLADSLGEILAGRVELPTVNLRTGPLRFRSGFNLLQATFTYGGALVVFFTLAMAGLYIWQSWTLDSQLAETQAQMDQIVKAAMPDQKFKSAKDALGAMEKRIKEAQARAKALGDGAVPPATDMVYALSNALPSPKDLTIDVTNMTITSRALEFEAEVDSYGAADQVEMALQATERFKTCTKSNEQQVRGKVSFNVLCEFNTPREEG